MFLTPILANMAVSAAKRADRRAYSFHIFLCFLFGSGVCVLENVMKEFVFAVFVVCFHVFNVWNGGFHVLFRRNFSVNAGFALAEAGFTGFIVAKGWFV